MKQTVKRIDQLVPSYAANDAIGNHVWQIQRLLTARGFTSEVFAEDIVPGIGAAAKPITDYEFVSDPQTVAIYHHSTQSFIPWMLAHRPGLNVLYFHNVTPPEFFTTPGDELTFLTCQGGLHQLHALRSHCRSICTVSEFNAQMLREYGFQDPFILPVLRDYDGVYRLVGKKSPSLDGRKNILFVGRFAPNKAQRDLLKIFKLYRDSYNQPCRLILIGKTNTSYSTSVLKLAHELGLRVTNSLHKEALAIADVVMPGSMSDSGLAEMYQAADVFLSLSEHEGFCVPLIEAMVFGVPVVAHRSTAIAETCGNSALLINKHNHHETMSALNEGLTNQERRAQLKELSRQRAQAFSLTVLESQFDSWLNTIAQSL